MLSPDSDDHTNNKCYLRAWNDADKSASPRYLVFNSLNSFDNEKKKLESDKEKATLSYTIEAFLYASTKFAKQNGTLTLVPLTLTSLKK